MDRNSSAKVHTPNVYSSKSNVIRLHVVPSKKDKTPHTNQKAKIYHEPGPVSTFLSFIMVLAGLGFVVFVVLALVIAVSLTNAGRKVKELFKGIAKVKPVIWFRSKYARWRGERQKTNV